MGLNRRQLSRTSCCCSGVMLPLPRGYSSNKVPPKSSVAAPSDERAGDGYRPVLPVRGRGQKSIGVNREQAGDLDLGDRRGGEGPGGSPEHSPGVVGRAEHHQGLELAISGTGLCHAVAPYIQPSTAWEGEQYRSLGAVSAETQGEDIRG